MRDVDNDQRIQFCNSIPRRTNSIDDVPMSDSSVILLHHATRNIQRSPFERAAEMSSDISIFSSSRLPLCHWCRKHFVGGTKSIERDSLCDYTSRLVKSARKSGLSEKGRERSTNNERWATNNGSCNNDPRIAPAIWRNDRSRYRASFNRRFNRRWDSDEIKRLGRQ